MTVTINGTSGITTPGLNSTASNVLGDNVADTLNVGNGAIVTDSSGNLGLGVTPSAWGSGYKAIGIGAYSDISSTTAGSMPLTLSQNAFYNGTNWVTKITSTSKRYEVSDVGFVWHNGALSTAGNAISFTQAMTLDASGNLLVGTTTVSPINGMAFLSINTTSSPRLQLGHPTGTASGGGYLEFLFNASSIGSIAQNGTTAVSYNTSSDYRLKENIQPMQNALGVVAQLNPVTYNWKADGSTGQGFIAHELQAVVPDCVTGEKDAVDAEGKPIYQGIDTSFLVATLCKAIQEQQELIASLTTRLTAAEEQILNLGVK